MSERFILILSSISIDKRSIRRVIQSHPNCFFDKKNIKGEYKGRGLNTNSLLYQPIATNRNFNSIVLGTMRLADGIGETNGEYLMGGMLNGTLLCWA